MNFRFMIAGGLFAIASGFMTAPESAAAAPFAPAATMATKARPTALGRERGRYDRGIRCVRAPCYVPRPHRPWHVRHRLGHYYGGPLVCRIRLGHHGPRQVCYPILF